MDGMKQKQQRPSVLQQVSNRASRQPLEHCRPDNISKEEVEADHLPQNPILRMGTPSKHHFLPFMRDASTEVGLDDSISKTEGARALFVGGLCRWPGCDAVSEDFPTFLKHLHSEHSHGDRSIAQWRVQQDIVQCMENQLFLEKQKLVAMQIHLSEHKCTDLKAASDWQYSLPLFLPRIAQVENNVIQQLGMKHLQSLAQHGTCAAGSAHLLQDVVPSIECYKYNNIRPPYTYAYLIRWSILESPDKQRTLNDIYNWFTTMFFFFRHNTATWKNAVRHNLSLHKCFVRVEGGKGAVWTVDETEYQRRKGQKYHRDSCVRWLTSYAHNCQENP